MAKAKFPKKVEVVQLNSTVFAISRPDLARMLKVTPQAIIGYEKQDYPLTRLDDKNLNEKRVWYDMIYALKWHSSNVKVINSSMGGLSENKTDEIDENSEVTISNAKEIQMIEEAKIKREDRKKKILENKILNGKYVSVDKADKLATSLGVMLISALQNLKEIMPQRVIGLKTIDEARDILDDTFEAEINALDDAVNKGTR